MTNWISSNVGIHVFQNINRAVFVLNGMVQVADYYSLKDKSFWMIHNCEVEEVQDSCKPKGTMIKEYRCVDCGRTFLNFGGRPFFDEVYLQKIIETVDELNKPHFLCKTYSGVEIMCVEVNSSYSVQHKRCKVLLQKRGNYVEAECLNCGKISPIAINSFSIAEDDCSFDKCKN